MIGFLCKIKILVLINVKFVKKVSGFLSLHSQIPGFTGFKVLQDFVATLHIKIFF